MRTLAVRAILATFAASTFGETSKVWIRKRRSRVAVGAPVAPSSARGLTPTVGDTSVRGTLDDVGVAVTVAVCVGGGVLDAVKTLAGLAVGVAPPTPPNDVAADVAVGGRTRMPARGVRSSWRRASTARANASTSTARPARPGTTIASNAYVIGPTVGVVVGDDGSERVAPIVVAVGFISAVGATVSVAPNDGVMIGAANVAPAAIAVRAPFEGV
jgi:hypothetical protein